jgi:hypothetical protein
MLVLVLWILESSLESGCSGGGSGRRLGARLVAGFRRAERLAHRNNFAGMSLYCGALNHR